MNRRNIALIGFMGTGKSTVGAALAGKLGLRHIDTDHAVQERAGLSIPQIFETRGERHFRELEKQIIRELLAQDGLVISTGGGSVLDRDNCALMKENAFVVRLAASKETIVRRISRDNGRPLVAGQAEQRVAELLEQRKHAYDFADFTVHTDGGMLEHTVRAILAALPWQPQAERNN